MIKETIEFTDFEGNKVTEDWYFNLSKADLLEEEVVNNLKENLATIQKTEDRRMLWDAFTGVVMMSVGKRSEDGRLFIKSQEVKDSFRWSPAYDELIVSFFSDADKASRFIRGIVPPEATEEVDRYLKEQAAKNNESK